MSIFEPVLTKMRKEGQAISEPQPFQEYLSEHGLPKKDTWSYISIDNLGRLDSLLRSEGVFVFRLGGAIGDTHTAFSCVDYGSTDNLPFIVDERDFKHSRIEGYIPDVPFSDLHPFSLIPSFTESTVVNLGLASGLLSNALRIDQRPSIPATGSADYSFEFQPLASQHFKLYHNQGRVEIDSLFTGMRKGRYRLFLIEAKCSKKLDSLAKHKLAYPYWALRPLVPAYIDIIPVYLRVLKADEALVYFVNECRFAGTSIDSLEVVNSTALEMPRGIGF